MLLTCALACIAALAWRRAHADEGDAAPTYRSTVRGADPQTVVTNIDATQPSTRLVSVADLLEGTSGVFIKSRGGLGSFTSVSIRGSEANEVAILVDGMPLTRAAAGVIDLSALSVAGLERVEVWRGVPPIEFGPEAVGGAINLVTRRGSLVPELRVSVGGGSFGARAASVGWSGRDHGVRVDLSAAYNGATGDFTYYDTAGTLFNQSDDRTSVRQNNGFDQGAVDATIAGAHWRLGAHGYIKQQGTPGVGLAGAESLHAHLVSARALVDGDTDRRVGAWLVRAAASLLYERLGFTNPLGEMAGPYGPNVTEAHALSEGLYVRARVPWGAHQRWLVLADLRGEERWPYDLLYPPQSGGASERLIGGVGVEDELRFADGKLSLTAGLRLDGDYNRLASTMTLPATNDVDPTGRVTVRYDVARWLTLRAAAGRFVRFPTLLELFGDGAFVLPQLNLRPEKAWAGDAGGTLRADGRLLHASLEATFFGRAVEDTIAYLPSSRAATAQNIGSARMLGVELRGTAALSRYVSARVEYAFVDARATDGPDAGGQIPGRPQSQLTLRADAHLRPFSVWYELEFVDRLYRDPANDAWVPARTLHAIGASFDRGWIRFDVEVRNLADLRVVQLPAAGTTVPYPLVDYFDYPLPGRAIYATLVFRK